MFVKGTHGIEDHDRASMREASNDFSNRSGLSYAAGARDIEASFMAFILDGFFKEMEDDSFLVSSVLDGTVMGVDRPLLHVNCANHFGMAFIIIVMLVIVRLPPVGWHCFVASRTGVATLA